MKSKMSYTMEMYISTAYFYLSTVSYRLLYLIIKSLNSSSKTQSFIVLDQSKPCLISLSFTTPLVNL